MFFFNLAANNPFKQLQNSSQLYKYFNLCQYVHANIVTFSTIQSLSRVHSWVIYILLVGKGPMIKKGFSSNLNASCEYCPVKLAFCSMQTPWQQQALQVWKANRLFRLFVLVERNVIVYPKAIIFSLQ